MENENKKGEDIKNLFKNLALIIVLSILLMIISFGFTRSTLDMDMFESYFKSWKLLLMNFIPIFILLTFIWLISNRLWLSYSIVGILIIAGGFANRAKLTYRDDPVIFSDIFLLGEAGMMAQEYKLPINREIILIFLGVIAFIFLIKKFFDFKIVSVKTRLISLLILVIIATGIFGTFYFDTDLYNEIGDEKLINKWIESEQFQSKGFVYPFIYSIKPLVADRIVEYDAERAEEILSKYPYTNIPEDKKVHIISVMLEAYNDFSKFDGVEFNKDIYEYFHELQEESISGNLITNVFAGGTVNTELSFLTGFQYHNKYNQKTNSHLWYLKEQGYFIDGMHPLTGSFYNRRNIYPRIGFDNFDNKETRYEKEHGKDYQWLRDKDFFEYIIKNFEEHKDKPYFNYALTYQNHGPYSEEPWYEEDYLVRKPEYPENLYNIANNYLGGIYDTNQQLEKLIDYFREVDEPVVLVFFGDHNPWLGQENAVYKMLGIDFDLGKPEGFLNYYSTPYLIWANDEAKKVTGNKFVGKGEDIGASLLMTKVFEELGWEGNEFNGYLKDIKKEFPVHHEQFFKVKGKYTKKLPKEKEKIFEDYQNIQKYYIRNFKEKKAK